MKKRSSDSSIGVRRDRVLGGSPVREGQGAGVPWDLAGWSAGGGGPAAMQPIMEGAPQSTDAASAAGAAAVAGTAAAAAGHPAAGLQPASGPSGGGLQGPGLATASGTSGGAGPGQRAGAGTAGGSGGLMQAGSASKPQQALTETLVAAQSGPTAMVARGSDAARVRFAATLAEAPERRSRGAGGAAANPFELGIDTVGEPRAQLLAASLAEPSFSRLPAGAATAEPAFDSGSGTGTSSSAPQAGALEAGVAGMAAAADSAGAAGARSSGPLRTPPAGALQAAEPGAADGSGFALGPASALTGAEPRRAGAAAAPEFSFLAGSDTQPLAAPVTSIGGRSGAKRSAKRKAAGASSAPAVPAQDVAPMSSNTDTPMVIYLSRARALI